MKKRIFVLLALFLGGALVSPRLYAQDSTATKQQKKYQKNRLKFVDKNGDGYNDLLPDDDGDGIPNRLDPDWQRMHKKKGLHKKGARFIDLDGDGINDLLFLGEGKNKHLPVMKGRHPAGPMGDKERHKSRGMRGKGRGHR